MASLRALRIERGRLFYSRPRGVTWAEVVETPEYRELTRAIDDRVAELEERRRLRGPVLPDISRDSIVSHMLRWLMWRGVAPSDDFTRELETHRHDGKPAQARYSRWHYFFRYISSKPECTVRLIERTEHPSRPRRTIVRWIGPNHEEWAAQMKPRRVDEWLQRLESRMVEGKLEPHEVPWLEALRKI